MGFQTVLVQYNFPRLAPRQTHPSHSVTRSPSLKMRSITVVASAMSSAPLTFKLPAFVYFLIVFKILSMLSNIYGKSILISPRTGSWELFERRYKNYLSRHPVKRILWSCTYSIFSFLGIALEYSYIGLPSQLTSDSQRNNPTYIHRTHNCLCEPTCRTSSSSAYCTSPHLLVYPKKERLL